MLPSQLLGCTTLNLDPVGRGLENPGYFSHLAEGSILLQRSGLLHPTEGTDTLTRHQPLPHPPHQRRLFSSPPSSPPLCTSDDLPTIKLSIAALAGVDRVPTQHKSMGRHLRGARTERDRPRAVPKRLPHRCGHDAKGLVARSGGGKTLWGGGGGGRNGGLHFFRLLTVISLVSEM